MPSPATDKLPEIVPIFPLPGVLLLPRAPLPLHIFEPRYRAMIRDAIADHGYIAMIQPNGEPGDDPMNPPVFRTGCVGKIVASDQQEDGRYNVVLRGICRMAVAEELVRKDGYRRVQADYAPFAGDISTDSVAPLIDREPMLDALKAFLLRRDLKANWDEVLKASDEMLVNSLAVACPFSPQEKQALLESPNVVERANLLQALCEMDTGAIANDNQPRPLH